MPSTSKKPALLWASLVVTLAACGVQEHPHEDEVETGTGGVIFKPPPPPGDGGANSASGGTGQSPSGGSNNGNSGGSNNASGGSNGGGSNNASGGSNSGNSGGSNNSSRGGSSAGGSGNPGMGGSSNQGSGGAPSGTGGRSGVTVDVNGTMLPKEDVIAFVHIGHSNMFGYGTSPSSSKAYHMTDVDLRAWQYHDGKWTPALERTATSGKTTAAPGAGPGTSLMKQAVELAPSRYFVSLGYGVGSAYCTQFKRGGLYYDEFMAGPKALKGKVTFGAIVIMLGITERHGTDQDIQNYPNCINDVVSAIRSDLGEPNLPLLISDYEMGATGSELSPTGAFGTKMIPRIREVPNVVSRSAIVPTDGLGMQDDHHFNLDGHKEWTKRLLTIMKDKGWFPW